MTRPKTDRLPPTRDQAVPGAPGPDRLTARARRSGEATEGTAARTATPRADGNLLDEDPADARRRPRTGADRRPRAPIEEIEEFVHGVAPRLRPEDLR